MRLRIAPGSSSPADLHDAVQHLAIVDADRVVAARDPRRLQRLAQHRAHLGVRRDGRRPHGVRIALVELPEPPRPRLLVAPDRPHLVPPVRRRQRHPVLRIHPRQRRRQVVAQRQPLIVLVLPGEDPLVRPVDVGQELAQRLHRLDRARLQGVEAPGVIDLADPRQHRLPRPHLGAEIVAEALGRLRPRAAGLLVLVLGHHGDPGSGSGALLPRRAAEGQAQPPPSPQYCPR